MEVLFISFPSTLPGIQSLVIPFSLVLSSLPLYSVSLSSLLPIFLSIPSFFPVLYPTPTSLALPGTRMQLLSLLSVSLKPQSTQLDMRTGGREIKLASTLAK